MGNDRSLFDYQYRLDYILDTKLSAAENTAAKEHDSKVKEHQQGGYRFRDRQLTNPALPSSDEKAPACDGSQPFFFRSN